MQPLDNPQPMYIPTRISPDVVASSRQLIPLGTVEMAGKSYYRFELGSGFFSAIKFYPVSVIRSINQMSETEVNETEVVIEPAKVVAEPVAPTINIGVAELEQTPAPVVEPEVKSELVGSWEVRHIVTMLAQGDYEVDDPEFAAMLNTGWTIANQQVNTIATDYASHHIITTFKRYTYRDVVKS